MLVLRVKVLLWCSNVSPFFKPRLQLRWCGSSTWRTRTGQTGIRQKQLHLNRSLKKVTGSSKRLTEHKSDASWLIFSNCVIVCLLSAPVASPAPSSPSQDDGGFTQSWVSHQEHQLGPLQSTDDTRREVQQMPSARPPVEEDDEESKC